MEKQKIDIIKGLERGENFYNIIMKLGLILLLGCFFVTMVTFWFVVYTYYEPLRDVTILMVKTISMSVKIFGFSALILVCVRIVRQLLISIKIKKEEDKWNRKKK